MITLFTNGVVVKLSLSKKSSEFGFSHFNLTNHPRGTQLSVKMVPCLTLVIVFALGGIPIPNSFTLTFDRLAVKKCHNSWPIINKKKRIMTAITHIVCFFINLYCSLWLYCYFVLVQWSIGLVWFCFCDVWCTYPS